MKKYGIVGLVAIFLSFIGNGFMQELAYAEEEETQAESKGLLGGIVNKVAPGWGDRVSLDVGLKVWVAKWQTPLRTAIVNSPPPGSANFPGSGIGTTQTSDTVPLLGPSITGSVRIRESDWLHSLSVNFTLLTASGFDFTPAGFHSTNVNNPGASFATDSTSAERRDYSIVGALAIWRGFGLFGGYYNTRQTFSGTQTFNTAGVFQTFSQSGEKTISGPIIGVYGNGTIHGPLKAYGNLALGFFDFELSQTFLGTGGFGASGSFEGVNGYAAEFGFSYDGPSLSTGLGNIGSAIQVGWRTQIINARVPTGQQGNDVTWGPTFQVVARF